MVILKMASTLIRGICPTGKILGSGSYGEVIEVEWCSTICAAKRMHDIFLRTLSPVELDKMVKDFEKECQIWTSFKHPNIVQLLGIYYPPNSRVPICIMEKMDTSLRHYLEGHSREEFLLPDKVSILCQVAQGLCYLHSQNPPLVHHDLSPNNILLNEWTFQTKLTDFGMTRAINLSKLTRKSSVKGTFAFMPPEALQVPPRYTEKLDVFSFGNCMITTLTHEWPNPSHPTAYDNGKLLVRTELERREHQIDQMSSREKDLFLPLVRRCLEGDAIIRPSSAELVSAMKQIESTLQSTEPSKIIQAQQAMSQLGLEREENTQLWQQLERHAKQLDEVQHQVEVKKVEIVDLRSITYNQREINEMLNNECENLRQQLEEEHKRHAELLQEVHQQHTEMFREAEANQKITQEILQNDVAQLNRDITRLRQENVHLCATSVSGRLGTQSRIRDWKSIGQCKRTIRDSSVGKVYAAEFFAVAISKEDILAVSDYKNNCICLFDREGKSVMTTEVQTVHVRNEEQDQVRNRSERLIEMDTLQEGREEGLSGIAFTISGHIAASDCQSQSVQIYAIGGRHIRTIKLKGRPGGLAVSTSGLIFISERSRHCISVYNEDGGFQFEFGSYGKDPRQFNGPNDVAFGPDGLVYVCDSGNERIQLFKDDGSYVNQFMTKKKPWVLSVSPDNHVIIKEHVGKMCVYSPQYQFVCKWKFDSTCRYISDLTVNSKGDVYVVNSTNCIYMF